MEVETETEASATPASDLVTALEQATLMAKRLPTTTDPSHLLQILTSLNSAHHHLSLFLSNSQPPPPPPHQPQPTNPPTPPYENSVSSAVGGGGVEENDETGGGEPMLMGDGEDEQNSRAATSAAAVERVVGRMRDCFIQNKRPKRQLSPSAAVAEQRRSYESEAERDGAAVVLAAEFDPLGTKLRSLDLVNQFHA